jgi:hypothetical protein
VGLISGDGVVEIVSVGATGVSVGVALGLATTDTKLSEAAEPVWERLFAASERVVITRERITTITARRNFMKDSFSAFYSPAKKVFG